MEEYNYKLNTDEFINASYRLYNTLNLADKQILLKYCNRKKTCKMNLNTFCVLLQLMKNSQK